MVFHLGHDVGRHHHAATIAEKAICIFHGEIAEALVHLVLDRFRDKADLCIHALIVSREGETKSSAVPDTWGLVAHENPHKGRFSGSVFFQEHVKCFRVDLKCDSVQDFLGGIGFVDVLYLNECFHAYLQSTGTCRIGQEEDMVFS